MALFGGKDKKQAKLDNEKMKYYLAAKPFYEESNMLNIWEKYPENAAFIGNIMASKTIAFANASGPGAFEKVQIKQNQIIIQQNEEIIELLKELNKK